MGQMYFHPGKHDKSKSLDSNPDLSLQWSVPRIIAVPRISLECHEGSSSNALKEHGIALTYCNFTYYACQGVLLPPLSIPTGIDVRQIS